MNGDRTEFVLMGLSIFGRWDELGKFADLGSANKAYDDYQKAFCDEPEGWQAFALMERKTTMTEIQRVNLKRTP